MTTTTKSTRSVDLLSILTPLHLSGDARRTWYNYAGFSLQSEEDQFGDLERTYVGRLADLTGSNPATATARYFTHDMLGSTRGVWNGSKTLLGAWEPTPYGDPYTDTLPNDILHRYTGHLLDPVTEAYYAPYRYYQPGAGRWMKRDPFGMIDGPNIFEYVGGNPTTVMDPLGLLGYDPRNDTPEGRERRRQAHERRKTWWKNLLKGLAFGLTNVLTPPNPLSEEGIDAAVNSPHIFRNLQERERMLEDMGLPRDDRPIDDLLEKVGLPAIKPEPGPSPRGIPCGATGEW